VHGARATRIKEVLDSDRQHDVEASCALQLDVTSVPARRLQTLLVEREVQSPGVALIASWDCRIEKTSPAAALFEIWWSRHLRPAVLRHVIRDRTAQGLVAPGDTEAILLALERPDHRFGESSRTARDALLLETLNSAWSECIALMGEAVQSWAWGRLHYAVFEHPLAGVVATSEFEIGAVEQGGSDSTPMHSGYDPQSFKAISGASVRLVIDVGDWDNSRAINVPGQSGNCRSAFYNNLAPLWAIGEYVPLFYSRAAVDEACAIRIALRPPREVDSKDH
jgi:penicillin amidase